MKKGMKVLMLCVVCAVNARDTTSTFAKKLHEIGAVSFGDFTFTSGMKAPMYIDLRLLMSHPKLLGSVAMTA